MISLLWHTEGKGTEDVEVVEQINVEDPPITGSHDFSFRVPDFPWSFSGTLISLIWAVEASLDPGGRGSSAWISSSHLAPRRCGYEDRSQRTASAPESFPGHPN